MLPKELFDFILASLPFLGGLGAEDRSLLARTCRTAHYRPGEVILSRGTECSGVVLVKSGQLRAFFETEDGRELTLYRLLPGDVCILSASCVLKNITFEVTLEAEKESEVAIIPASAWARLAEKDAGVKQYSMELVNERFSEVMWVMEQLVSKKMGERVAAFLLEQSVLEGSDTLSMTHETIAKNLGTAREVVSRILKYLENDGLLRYSRGRITLTDVKKLRELSR